MFHFIYVLFFFLFFFFLLIPIYKYHGFGIFIIVSLGIFVIIISIMIWFINFPQDQIIILRGNLDEVDKIISELSGNEGVKLFYSSHMGGLQVSIHTPFLPFTRNIAMVNITDDTTIIIL